MTKILKFFAALLIAFTAAAPGAAQAQNSFSQRELDQMLAPIALYPDPLLSQVLMAATYPRDVVEAADWSRTHPDLQGDDAVRAVAGEDWDPSVKSLVASPQLLARMDEKLEWTRDLGDAFLAQEAQMMDTVQQLRQRAYDAGNLESSEQLQIQRVGALFRVLFASPQYVYVPYYDPMVVYGSWWWPAYRPVYWSPWAGYARHHHHAAYWWGRPTHVSNNFFFGNVDWQRRHVHVVHVNNYYYRSPVVADRTVAAAPGRWQHNPHHRRDVAYRDPAVRARFDAARHEHRQDRDQRPQAARRDARLADRRDDHRNERRDERQAAPAQAQPQAPAATERRADRRDERRDERRADRREERQTAPAQSQSQSAAQPRAEQRDDRRAERQAQEAQRQAQQQAHEAQRKAQEAQRQAQQQAHEAQRKAQEAQRQAVQEAQRKARQEQPASMPAAQAPQTPRADRQERREQRQDKRDEKREERHEKREERGHKAG